MVSKDSDRRVMRERLRLAVSSLREEKQTKSKKETGTGGVGSLSLGCLNLGSSGSSSSKTKGTESKDKTPVKPATQKNGSESSDSKRKESKSNKTGSSESKTPGSKVKVPVGPTTQKDDSGSSRGKQKESTSNRPGSSQSSKEASKTTIQPRNSAENVKSGKSTGQEKKVTSDRPGSRSSQAGDSKGKQPERQETEASKAKGKLSDEEMYIYAANLNRKDIPIYLSDPGYSEEDAEAARASNMNVAVLNSGFGFHRLKLSESTLLVDLHASTPIIQRVFEITRPAAIITLGKCESYTGMEIELFPPYGFHIKVIEDGENKNIKIPGMGMNVPYGWIRELHLYVRKPQIDEPAHGEEAETVK
ncbi:hypothetical protein ACEPPN_010799 [Leptodophora sp. 'Broadleaf-Isolate-01']